MTGAIPYWYRLVKASKYLGVAPWDLAQQSAYWLEAAEQAREADNHAEAIRNGKR